MTGEFTVMRGNTKNAAAIQLPFDMGPASGNVVSRDKPKGPVEVVYYDTAASPGRSAGFIPGDPTLVKKRPVNNTEFAQASVTTLPTPVVSTAVYNGATATPPAQPELSPPANLFTIPTMPPATISNTETESGSKDVLCVTFERDSGDSLTAHFHDMVFDGTFLTFIYDHKQRNGVLYRPGVSEDPLYVLVEGEKAAENKMYKCYATGYRLRYKHLEFIAFTVDEVRSTANQE